MTYKPYKRPVIDLDAKPKTWADRSPNEIEVGCIIPDKGQVVEVRQSLTMLGVVYLKFANGGVMHVADTTHCFQ